MITSERSLRAAFWRHCPYFKRMPGWTQNQYQADVRQAWCDYVDCMQKEGMISEALAQRAKL